MCPQQNSSNTFSSFDQESASSGIVFDFIRDILKHFETTIIINSVCGREIAEIKVKSKDEYLIDTYKEFQFSISYIYKGRLLKSGGATRNVNKIFNRFQLYVERYLCEQER